MIHSYPGGKINIGEDQNEFSGTDGFDATWDKNIFYNNVEPQLTAALDPGAAWPPLAMRSG